MFKSMNVYTSYLYEILKSCFISIAKLEIKAYWNSKPKSRNLFSSNFVHSCNSLHIYVHKPSSSYNALLSPYLHTNQFKPYYDEELAAWKDLYIDHSDCSYMPSDAKNGVREDPNYDICVEIESDSSIAEPAFKSNTKSLNNDTAKLKRILDEDNSDISNDQACDHNEDIIKI